MEGTPVRFDPDAQQARTRKTFARACTALAYTSMRPHEHLDEILDQHWRGDDAVARMTKAISNPTDSTNWYQVQPGVLLPSLIPGSAAGQILEFSRSVSLAGVNTIKLPYIGFSGRLTLPWVAEGQPGPVSMMTTSSLTLGPVKKLLLFTAITRELETATPESASQIISEALRIAATHSMDAWLFSTNASSSAAPPGLLNGLTPVTSSAANGQLGVAEDIAKLASTIEAAGINPDNMILVTNASNAFRIRVLASPKLTNLVLTSPSIPAGNMIAIVPEGIATGYGADAISVETSIQSTLHYEDTTPLPLVSSGGTVAVPQKSAYQQDFISFRVRGRMTTAVHPGAVQYMTGINW
jgi:hypothetical protein